MEINEAVLESAGLSPDNIQEILRYPRDEDRINRLRACRGRLLNELHTREQTLDNLDFIIWSKTHGRGADLSAS